MGFGLVLVGKAIAYLPYFILAFRALGEEGIGKGRGGYRLRRIVARHPLRGDEMVVYEDTDRMVRNADLAVSGRELVEKQMPQTGCTVHFLTPTRLRSGGELQERPAFHLLYRAALRRVSSLLAFHCDATLDIDFRGEIAAAQRIRLTEDRTHWEDWERYSFKQGRRMVFRGIVGQARYEGDMERFGPLLRVVELAHVGKSCTFGLGEIGISK